MGLALTLWIIWEFASYGFAAAMSIVLPLSVVTAFLLNQRWVNRLDGGGWDWYRRQPLRQKLLFWYFMAMFFAPGPGIIGGGK